VIVPTTRLRNKNSKRRGFTTCGNGLTDRAFKHGDSEVSIISLSTFFSFVSFVSKRASRCPCYQRK
jgi:hypothetical protein